MPYNPDAEAELEQTTLALFQSLGWETVDAYYTACPSFSANKAHYKRVEDAYQHNLINLQRNDCVFSFPNGLGAALAPRSMRRTSPAETAGWSSGQYAN